MMPTTALRALFYLMLFVGLATLTGCARGGVTAPQVLPPIPEHVMSVLGPIPVIWADSIPDGNGQQFLGAFHPGRREIFLLPILGARPIVAWQVLEHEKCHVWMHDSGLHNLIPRATHQAICDMLATQRVREMLMRVVTGR
jgi:hypothetical protein